MFSLELSLGLTIPETLPEKPEMAEYQLSRAGISVVSDARVEILRIGEKCMSLNRRSDRMESNAGHTMRITLTETLHLLVKGRPGQQPVEGCLESLLCGENREAASCAIFLYFLNHLRIEKIGRGRDLTD